MDNHTESISLNEPLRHYTRYYVTLYDTRTKIAWTTPYSYNDVLNVLTMIHTWITDGAVTLIAIQAGN